MKPLSPLTLSDPERLILLGMGGQVHLDEWELRKLRRETLPRNLTQWKGSVSSRQRRRKQ